MAGKLVSISVIEKASGRWFGPQYQMFTRHIDPTVYVWPGEGFESPEFQPSTVRKEDIPLPWSGAPAAELAQNWQFKVQDYIKRKRIQMIYGCAFLDESRSEAAAVVRNGSLRRVRVLATAGDGPAPMGDFRPYREIHAGMIVLATGPGDEVVSIPSCPFVGRRYWENDPLEAPQLGFRAAPRVLIVGNGDGGLQDLMRLHFQDGGDFRSVLRRIFDGGPDLHGAARRGVGDIERLVSGDDGDNRRARLPVGRGVVDCCVLREVQEKHQRVADNLYPGLAERIESLLRKDVHRVQLAFPCDHFSPFVFPLNVFLVLLLRRHMLATRDIDIFLPKQRLIWVTKAKPWGEDERDWQTRFSEYLEDLAPQWRRGPIAGELKSGMAVFRPEATCEVPDGMGEPTVTDVYHEIVIRFGVQTNDLGRHKGGLSALAADRR